MLKPPLQPMLLTSLEKPFNCNNFLYEYKWDGFRCIYFIDENRLFLQSRNGNNLLHYFPELKDINNYIKEKSIILDGEICFFSENGALNFTILQKRFKSKNVSTMADRYPVTLIVWDVLTKNNCEVYKLPLDSRKKILKEIIIEENNLLQISPYIYNNGLQLFEKAKETQMEGIVAKKRDSPYEFKRSKYWLKIKVWKYTDVFIGGYTPQKTSLVIGKFLNDNNILTYMGKIKLALPREEEIALFKFLPELKSSKKVFKNLPVNINIINVKPLIKCRVKYFKLTDNNNFRHGQAVKILV